MMNHAFDTAPEIRVSLRIPQNGYELNQILRLPVYANKFIDKVDMPENVFANNWDKITNKTPDSFQKIDIIVNNPAPKHVPVDKVIQQMENFFSTAMNMRVFKSEFQLDAVGQIYTKPQAQGDTFPSNPDSMAPSENVPLMI